MDSRIDRIVTPDTFSLSRTADRRRERRFTLPRQEGENGSGERSEPSEEPSHILEPRPRPDQGHTAVSRNRLDDEVGQRIDLQG